MPSTYSNLKIQLMATGENNTTWGNVTNINLGTAIEEAIAGSADVTFASGDVTLTLSDTNATQTARNMRLRCTGTTGGARNLTVPSIEKAYIVQNDCADAVTVKTAAGSGIAVPAGKTMWVYNNGTNVVDVVNYLSALAVADLVATNAAVATLAATNLTATNLTSSNVSITGGSITGITDLAVADGGTGASNAATARSNLGAAASGANTDITALDQDVTITATGTIAADSLGFRGLPQNAQTGAYTLALADAGKHISNTTGGFVIPANGSVAFPVGTAIVLFNNSGSSQTISITSDTLRLAGSTSTGSRTLAAYGLATCVKVATTTWVVSGNVS